MLLLLHLSAAQAAPSVSPFVGAHLGPAFSLSDLGPAVAPRLELGLKLPTKGILRVFASGQWLRPVAEGGGTEARVAGADYRYTLRQHELAFAVGPTVRLPNLGIPFAPEASLAPQLVLHQSRIEGSAGGAAFGESREQYTRVGLYAAVGFAVPVKPVEITLQGVLSTTSFGGVVTGDATGTALAPMLGLRFVP